MRLSSSRQRKRIVDYSTKGYPFQRSGQRVFTFDCSMFIFSAAIGSNFTFPGPQFWLLADCWLPSQSWIFFYIQNVLVRLKQAADCIKSELCYQCQIICWWKNKQEMRQEFWGYNFKLNKTRELLDWTFCMIKIDEFLNSGTLKGHECCWSLEF